MLQMVWPEVIGSAIEGVESATFLTPEQKQDIFYNNFAMFFRLEKKLMNGQEIGNKKNPDSRGYRFWALHKK